MPQPLQPESSIALEAIHVWTIIGVLVVLWILGFSFNIGGGVIHALIVIALLLFVFNLITGRRSA